ncbi:uncharacterized protein EDB93DRAFT_1253485 [Suillus bovinus]|uniref:uncharacterized protein n=1 Tax=Suillus bovinus TaxID=48563 RepID=UPI001B87F7F7|nr:uncharacterized protein EDB93DRAFT_1253485 [Suillus bovinus]KAG2138104.1 hypothetical protein EDB93DRAFT_1253485 [Suillus bovinus]
MDTSDFGWQTQYICDLLALTGHSESGQLQVKQSQPGLSFPAGGTLGYNIQAENASNVLGHTPDNLHATFGHGDVHAGPSAGHHNYNGYPNTQGNIDFGLEQPVQQYGPGSRFSVAAYALSQVSGYLELLIHNNSTNLNVQHGNYLMPSGSSQQGVQTMLPHSLPGHHADSHYDGGHNYDSNLNAQHGNYLVPSGSSQQGMQMMLPHSFPGHDVDGHYDSGHNYNFTVSHGMNDPPPLPDTHHSVVSHSSNNSQPAMSNNVYYFMRSNNSNLQAPLDPIPEVTRKLIHGRHTSHKTKTAASTQMKFLKSKYVTQESPLSTEHASSLFIFLTVTLLQDFKGDIQSNMFKKLFKDNLFPSPTELSTIANDTLDATIARYTTENANHGHELTHWKSGLDAKKLLTRLKGVLKKIHGDFEEITSISWISAYNLSLDLSISRDKMQAVQVANMTSLLSDFLFADKIVEQYSWYIPLGTESWIPPLTNTIALAVTLRAWSLKKALAVLQEHLDAWAPTIFLLILLVSALASYPYPDLTLVILVILAFPFALYLLLQQSQYIWPDPFADEAYPCSVPPPD